MRLEALFAAGERETALRSLAPAENPLESLLPGSGPWEVEIGFGKGRHLLQQAAAHPERRFLGIEVVSKYFRRVQQRALRRRLDNLLVVRGEALYLLSTVLPQGFADVLHVYFPDPWPKSRHHKRRLFDPETVDLVLGALRPGGRFFFATDFLAYGEEVAGILAGYPGLQITRHEGPWPDGARTNYEAKYMAEGRPILRLSGQIEPAARPGGLHPVGAARILTACASQGNSEESG